VALWDLGRRDEAVQAYRRALAARPDSAMTHNNLGVALMRTDDGAGAEARTELLAALASANDPAAVAYAHVSLGNLLRQGKDYAAAEKEYETARRLMPQHPAPLLNLGVASLMRKDNVAAEGVLRRVAAMDNERRAVADAHRLLGDLSLKESRFDQAVVEYEQALEARPDHAFAHCNLGAAYRKLKRFDEAEAAYRRALELDNDPKATGAAHNNLGNLLMNELNRPAEAAEHFRKALQYDPGNATIQKNLERLQGRG
jgi:Flp pilus assembly protein TadD